MAVVRMKKGDRVDFEKNMYNLKWGKFIFSLCNPLPEKFIFVCYTDNDHYVKQRLESETALIDTYKSAEEAISSLVDNYEIYQFEDCEEWIKWFFSETESDFSCISHL